MHRQETNHEIDRKIFRSTAAKTKKMNVEGKIMRGGTRL